MVVRTVAFIAALAVVPGWASDTSVEGCWAFESEDSVLHLVVEGDVLRGTVVAGLHDTFQEGEEIGVPGELRTDVLNPDPNLRTRPVIGMDIVEATWDDDIWRGTIYDPGSGSTYSSTAETRRSKLRLRGHIGVSLFGRTEVLERVPADVPWPWVDAEVREICSAYREAS